MNPDLIKVTELFLIPSSFIVAALGTADSNPHRAAVSVLGFIISILWLICSREALAELSLSKPDTTAAATPRRTFILGLMPWVFILGWLTSMVIHTWLWKQPVSI